MIGIADAKDVQAGNFGGSPGDGVRVVLEQRPPAVVIGIPRRALGAAPAAPVRLVAAVGSSFQHNDDVPDTGAALLPR
jgi:hypothetical protein